MILLGIPTHIAVASSEFAMAITNGVGVVTHGLLNNLSIESLLINEYRAKLGLSLSEETPFEGTIRDILYLDFVIKGLNFFVFLYTNPILIY